MKLDEAVSRIREALLEAELVVWDIAGRLVRWWEEFRLQLGRFLKWLKWRAECMQDFYVEAYCSQYHSAGVECNKWRRDYGLFCARHYDD